MKYRLQTEKKDNSAKASVLSTFQRLFSLMGNERTNLYIAMLCIFVNAILNLVGPYVIGYTVDNYLVVKQFDGVIKYGVILLLVFCLAMASGYIQTQLMGRVGQRMLFNLRNAIFNKLQDLPIDFFHQNKVGDLISRINNDTDKINQFFSQSLVQFASSIFTMLGAGVTLLFINIKLGLVACLPALLLFIFTRIISPWVKNRNTNYLNSTGNVSAEIQESLQNFKLIVAFNRRDYFRKRFDEVNATNYQRGIQAGIASNIFAPVYSFSASIGQMVVLIVGIYFITLGQFSLGLLISFLGYVSYFYNPLRQIAALWGNFQIALAGWDRISTILAMENNLNVVDAVKKENTDCIVSFRNVSFAYLPEKEILQQVNFCLERGKKYAFVGPTGGGKTTTALLMARLYDPTQGEILIDGIDIRSLHPADRTAKIGFIPQEPVLFTGTLRDNILYGNACFNELSDETLMKELQEVGLDGLIAHFDSGLTTPIKPFDDSMSLGQKQLVAFIRAIIRRPNLLILDEASANIDTVTEQLLSEILNKLPKSTVQIIIAHRLNTIENADEIYFVNAGTITKAGSMNDAIALLMGEKRYA